MQYQFELTGRMPILMHANDILLRDEVKAWQKDPRNKAISVPGDDRTPPWTWQTYLYTDGENLAVSQEAIMAALRNAGAKIQGKGKSTFKAMTQSGLLIGSEYCEFLSAGETIRMSDILAFRDEPFSVHTKRAKEMGFELRVGPCKIGTSSHIRVRPQFKRWLVRGEILVTEPAITSDVLSQLFEIAGRLSGLLDWRPNSKQPGPYGTFTAKLERVQ